MPAHIEVMWLINRLKPDFKTIADFHKNNKAAFVATCRAFVPFCRTAGLIAGDLVAIDGSKFQAVACARRHLNLTAYVFLGHLHLACRILPSLANCTMAKRICFCNLLIFKRFFLGENWHSTCKVSLTCCQETWRSPFEQQE